MDLSLNNPHFVVSLRFELCYALNVLLSPTARIHPEWREATLASLPEAFHTDVAALGGASEIFPVLPALLDRHRAEPAFAELLAGWRELSPRAFSEQVLAGLLHTPAAVTAILEEGLSLAEALRKVPKAKQEWLRYIGLYPYNSAAPTVRGLEAMIAAPEAYRETLLRVIGAFWHGAFRDAWTRLMPQLRRSLQIKERLHQTCSLAEFCREALIRVDVDEVKAALVAIRGGYCLPLSELRAAYMMPSAFNDRRYWSALGADEHDLVAYFPYFDPALSLSEAPDPAAFARPQTDVALVFKAMGDSTRFAMLSLLAQRPQSAVELARALGLAKPTVSHHCHQLREAGLLLEVYQAGSVRLSVNRAVLEELSSLTLATLFAPAATPALRTTRRKGSDDQP